MRFFLILINILGFIFPGITWSQSNQDLIVRLLKTNLEPYYSVKIIKSEISQENDLELFLNNAPGLESNERTLTIRNLSISVLYRTINKFPFVQRKISRTIRIGFWLDDGTGYHYRDIKYRDELSMGEMSAVENPNLAWTRGKFDREEVLEPSWIPAFLLISGSVIVIFTFFYVRS